MASKYYAVKVGRQPGVYTTWAACQEQTKGFSGAVFKSFATQAEAEAFVSGQQVQQATKAVSVPETEVVAYVDGSFDKQTNRFSYGMVLFHNGQEHHLTKAFTDDDLATMRNVAGEIKGAEAAMQYCLDNQVQSLTIYYDYMGIALWCTGEWQAKQPGTQAYAQFYKQASQQVAIHFVKVKGHSGDTYNELADQLAKQALGIKS